MINPPSTRIEYHISGANCFWSSCDDSINVYDPSTEDMICITGIEADSAFLMCRNLMCCKANIFGEIGTGQHTLRHAEEMRDQLDTFIKANTKDAESNNVVELSSWERRLLHKLFTKTN